MQSLAKLSKNGLVRGLSVENIPASIECVVCMKAKICSSPFKKNTDIKSSAPLEIVHSDICGPMRVTSLGGYRYFGLFIDDYSRKTFVHFLKKKSDILSEFKIFKARAERELGRKIKILRTDNGCEYVNAEFNRFLEEEGIKRQLTVQHTPQQNGVAERANRTVVEMARCMLLSSNVPEYLWGEAVNTAVYLRNRSPTKLLRSTPYEMWCEVKPAVHHLRTFGCKAVLLDKRPGKSKFAARGIECVMVGYSPESKAYRLYDPVSRKIVKSRDVKFIEENGKANDDRITNDFCLIEPTEAERDKPAAVKTESDNEADFDDAIGDTGGDSGNVEGVVGGAESDNDGAVGGAVGDDDAGAVGGAVGDDEAGAVGEAVGDDDEAGDVDAESDNDAASSNGDFVRRLLPWTLR